jgi:hypothetical protein
VQLKDLMGSLSSTQVCEYKTAVPGRCDDVAETALAALQHPEDFPPIDAAIVPGDRLALAIDPNVPQIDQVVKGVMQAIANCGAASIEIVLWDEACDETVQSIRDAVGSLAAVESLAAVGSLANVTRHQPCSREAVRYLAADSAALPIYLNRRVVDADFVLPIVAARPMDPLHSDDLTGIFPALADSATRARQRDERLSAELSETDEDGEAETDKTTAGVTEHDSTEMAWLLGVHVLLSVEVSDSGEVGGMVAGTLQAISRRMRQTRQPADEFPPPSPLVIAALDGDQQQQSWANAARAVAAATRFVSPGGTIVLWSEIEQAPSGRLVSPEDDPGMTPDSAADETPPDDSADFPAWDETIGPARTFARVMQEYRLLMHSRLSDEVIESMGMGVVGSVEELSRLSGSFPQCGVLGAAQFAGSTVVDHQRVVK